MHIRRTDFVYLRHTQDEYRSVFDKEFYQAAIVYMEQAYPGCIFMVFCDEIRYAKQILGDRENLSFVNAYGGPETDIEELLCMSMCRHRILTSGSSYGRMADKLGDDMGQTVYWNWSAKEDKSVDNFFFLGMESIQELSGRYEAGKAERNREQEISAEVERIKLCRDPDEGIRLIDRMFQDSYWLRADSLNAMLYQKAQFYMRKEDYPKAELCIIPLWQYFYGNADFHRLYFEVLYRSGKVEESILEAVMYERVSGRPISGIQKLYEAQDYVLYCALTKGERKHFIFFPFSYHISYFKNIFEIMAFALKRMGHQVTFIYKEAEDEHTVILPGYHKIYNYILQHNYFASNGIGYNYHYMQYDYNRVTEQEDLRDFLYHICQQSQLENLIITHNEEVIVDKREDIDAKFVFWDFSNEYDLDTAVWQLSQSALSEEKMLTGGADFFITEDNAVYEKWEKGDLANKCRLFARKSRTKTSFTVEDREIGVADIFGVSRECLERVHFLCELKNK